jgi:leukotriene-A4 hydrolase
VSARIHDVNFSKVNAYVGNTSATSDMISYGLNNNFSSLYPLLDSEFPDDSFSEIPYEKGFQLLWYLESLIGPELMQGMLRNYILENSQKSVNFTIF